MATKRMLSALVTESDDYIDLPFSSQALYQHLNMHADDDGFLGNAKMVVRMCKANDEDLRLLIEKEYLLRFPNGVVAIRHWRIHNTITRNRYRETLYLEEKKQLLLKEDKTYSFTEGVPLMDQISKDMDGGVQVAHKWRTSGAQVTQPDIDVDINKEPEEKKKSEKEKEKEDTKQTRFVKPTMDELIAYKHECKLNVDCSKFYDFYESKGWMIGKNHMKDWKAAMRNWAREKPRSGTTAPNRFHNFSQRNDDLDAVAAAKTAQRLQNIPYNDTPE